MKPFLPLLSLCCGFLSVAPLRAQDGGTINPATIDIRTIFQVPVPASSTQVANLLTVDAAVNYYVREGASSPSSPTSTIAKYDVTGTLVWTRTRTVATVTAADGRSQSVESWYPGGPQVPVSNVANTSLDVRHAVVDAQGNVTVAFVFLRAWMRPATCSGDNRVCSARSSWISSRPRTARPTP